MKVLIVGGKGQLGRGLAATAPAEADIVEEALKNDISLETSSAYDMDIVRSLYEKGKYGKDIEVICNGFKTDDYTTGFSLNWMY